MSSANAIEITGLKKKYKDTEALRGVSFTVPQGSLCGLIGLNGAGKTTTIKILLDLLKRDEGEVSVLGVPMNGSTAGRDMRARSAYLPERKDLFPYMKVGDVVEFTKSFYPKWNGEREVRLKKRMDLNYEKCIPGLSKGMLSKLHLLLALCRGAELLILDEPTDGLDALAAQLVEEEMVSLVAEEGVTILHCSHRMEEVEQIADRLVILHEGRVLLERPLDELRSGCRQMHFVFRENAEEASRQLAALGPVRLEGRAVSLLAIDNSSAAESIARQLGVTEIVSDAVPLRRMFVELVRS